MAKDLIVKHLRDAIELNERSVLELSTSYQELVKAVSERLYRDDSPNVVLSKDEVLTFMTVNTQINMTLWEALHLLKIAGDYIDSIHEANVDEGISQN